MQLRILLGIILFFTISVNSFAEYPAQSKYSKQVISAGDSILLEKYMYGMNHSRLYSNERQLYLDSALAITPWRGWFWQQKAMPLFKMKKYEIGMVFLDSAIKYDEQNKWLDYRAFIKCIFQKQYRASIIDFEEAKRTIGFSFVMDHSYDFYMGLCNVQLNNFTKADSLVRTSIKWSEKQFKQGHYLEYYYLGIIQMELNEDSAAILSFDKSLELYSHFPDPKYYKAVCLDKLGRRQEAVKSNQEGMDDFIAGYTSNEDNAIYEEYPYYVKKHNFERKAEFYADKVK